MRAASQLARCRGQRRDGEAEHEAAVPGPDLGQAGPGTQQSDHVVGVQEHFARLLLGVGDGAHDADQGHDQHRRNENAAADAYDGGGNGERDG